MEKCPTVGIKWTYSCAKLPADVSRIVGTPGQAEVTLHSRVVFGFRGACGEKITAAPGHYRC